MFKVSPKNSISASQPRGDVTGEKSKKVFIMDKKHLKGEAHYGIKLLNKSMNYF